MKVEAFRCDVCGKEEKVIAGWVRVFAECQGGHQAYHRQAGQEFPIVSATVRVTRGGNVKNVTGVDLCSRECAATWLFGAP